MQVNVCRAISVSSFVGTTKTLTGLSLVYISVAELT